MRRCACVPQGPGYLCTCQCGTRIKSTKANVFHVCDPPVQPLSAPGPGTELKALLKTIGITAQPNCSCNKRAQAMDQQGCDWCEANIDTISGWLEEEAKKRKLPYVHAAGKMLIRLAIRRARKKGNG